MDAKGVKLVTPRGTVKFPEMSGEDNDKWSGALSFAKEGNEKFVKVVNDHSEAEGVKSPFKNDTEKNDKDEYVPNGKLLLNFSSKFEPIFFTEAGVKMDDITRADIGWGSDVTLSITLKPVTYKGKPKLPRYVGGVVVHELKGGEPTAVELGFDFDVKSINDILGTVE